VELDLTLQTEDGSGPLIFNFLRMVNAGYVGRNQEEVQSHIDELKSIGIPGPRTTPVLYPVVRSALVTDNEIEVYGEETSGEVEYVLLVETGGNVYVGLGSDHTDRHLEKSDIPRSKQLCSNVLSRKVWPLAEVEDHWDKLIMRSSVTKDVNEIPYQESRLEAIISPRNLLAFVKDSLDSDLEGTVIYSGTVALLTGKFVFADLFEAQLLDEELHRNVKLAYDVRPMNYLKAGD